MKRSHIKTMPPTNVVGPTSTPLLCAKRRFDSELEAGRAAVEGGLRGKVRAYRCGLCEGWHLTHNAKRRETRRRSRLG